ncbi:unnamed protein product [Orchesella dallaii]|uniref:Gustatory receptor n=1 Tax=Orchesella dallaii TaxID=48710 RepID=A0ABP1R6M2_9HEXA
MLNTLTSLEMFAFQLQEILYFFYLIPIPFKFNEGFTKVNISKERSTWILWGGSMTIMFIYGLVQAFSIVRYTFFCPLDEFELVHKIVLTLGTTMVLGGSVLTLVALRDITTFVSGFNEMLKLNLNVENCKVIGTATAPFFVTGIALSMNWDGTYFILEEVLTHPFNRTQLEILTSLGIRGIPLFLISLETARGGSFCFSIFILTIAKFIRVTNCLLSSELGFDSLFRFQLHQRLVLKKIQGLLFATNHLCLFVVFWITVASLCISLKGGGGTIPTVIWYCAILIANFLIVGISILLPDVARTCDSCKTVVENCQVSTRSKYKVWKTKTQGINFRKAVSMIPIRIPYGSFYIIGLEFAVDYFTLIMLRTVDAILIEEL